MIGSDVQKVCGGELACRGMRSEWADVTDDHPEFTIKNNVPCHISTN